MQSRPCVSKLRSGDVRVTTQQREWCFPLSERFGMAPLVTPRNWRDCWVVTPGHPKKTSVSGPAGVLFKASREATFFFPFNFFFRLEHIVHFGGFFFFFPEMKKKLPFAPF